MIKTAVLTELAKHGIIVSREEPRRVTPQLRRDDWTAKLYADIRALPIDPAWTIWRNHGILIDYMSIGRLTAYHHAVKLAEDAGVALDEARVLDVGACAGGLLRVIQARFPRAQLSGIDYYQECVDVTRALLPDGDIAQGAIQDLAGMDRTWDVLFCTEVLEHIVDTETPIPSMLAKVAPGGALVVTVPNGRRDTSSAQSSSDGNTYGGHVNFWSEQSWEFYLDRVAPGVRRESGLIPGGDFVDDCLYAVLFQDA
jgi:2-polyprenyl-3-methyl-5-hydroxy-6-metoxy-1,4-benzoquinol methylase